MNRPEREKEDLNSLYKSVCAGGKKCRRRNSCGVENEFHSEYVGFEMSVGSGGPDVSCCKFGSGAQERALDSKGSSNVQ